MMKKEDQELKTLMSELEIRMDELKKGEIYNELERIYVRCQQLRLTSLESSHGILIPAGTLKVGDVITFENGRKINLKEIEKLLMEYADFKDMRLDNDRDVVQLKIIRNNIGYSIEDL